MLNHHKLFIAGLALLLTGLLFIGPVAVFGATNFEDGSTGGGGGTGEVFTKPDLTITKVELSSANPVVGEVQTVSVYVKNLGTSLTSGQGIDNWYAAIDGMNWSPDDFSGGVAILADRQIDAAHPMVQGETIVFRGQGTFTSAGTKVGTFRVDNANELEEANESNNSFEPSITVVDTATTGPDLSVAYLLNRYQNKDNIVIDNVNNDVVVINQPITIEAIIANKGLAPSETSSLDIYIDNVFKKRLAIHPIIGGGTGTEDDFYTWTPTQSTHSLKIVLDPENTNSETNENNNEYTVSLHTVANESLITRTLDLSPFEVFNPNTSYTVVLRSATPGDFTGTLGTATFDIWAKGGTQVVATLGPITVGSGYHSMKDYGFSLELYYVSGSGGSNNGVVAGIRWKALLDESTTGEKIQIKDVKVTGVTPQSAVVLWRTSSASSGKVYYRLLAPTANSSEQKVSDTWLVAEDKQSRTNHEVKLSDLVANKKYQFYVMSAGSNGTDVKSETKDFTTRPANNVEKPKSDDTTPVSKPDDKIGPLPRQIAPTDEVLQLRERVKKLQLRVSELETKLLEREKSLAQPKDEKLTNQVKGKIILDVEKDKGGNGEAWYVDPITAERYYLKDGDTAYQAMQAFGLGISSVDLQKIPIAVDPKLVEKDTDGDGLSDDLEEAVGSNTAVADSDADGYKDGEEVQNQYSPVGKEKMPIDKALCQRLKGRVVIDVNNKGRAWYIDPVTCQRYYLRNGDQAYKIMRYRSTGISRDNLNKLPVGELTTTE